ncbi:MAG: hypothetical protein ACI84O_000946 [Myxococcota bacterium]|jgi:hypothetical protein
MSASLTAQTCTDDWLSLNYFSDNGAGGNMFDMTPSVNMTIECIDVNVSSIVGSAVTVELWLRVGTCVGFDTDPAGWISLGIGTGSSAGLDLPTNVDFAGNGYEFQAGQLYGVFVDIQSSSARYTNGGPTTFTNPELEVVTYYGKSGWGSTFSYREWNGAIYYAPAGLVLSLDELQSSGLGTFSMTSLEPGDEIYFAISIAGLGSSSSVFGQIGLAAPSYIIPPHPLIANAAGEASLSIRLPARAQGYELFVQGLEISFAEGLLLSDAMSGLIQ